MLNSGRLVGSVLVIEPTAFTSSGSLDAFFQLFNCGEGVVIS